MKKIYFSYTKFLFPLLFVSSLLGSELKKITFYFDEDSAQLDIKEKNGNFFTTLYSPFKELKKTSPSPTNKQITDLCIKKGIPQLIQISDLDFFLVKKIL